MNTSRGLNRVATVCRVVGIILFSLLAAPCVSFYWEYFHDGSEAHLTSAYIGTAFAIASLVLSEVVAWVLAGFTDD
jgi:hypothetical protein